jgi:hypothetical protein
LEAPDESIAALYELAKDGMSEGRDPYTNGATDALKALAGFGPRLEPQASKIVELLELESAGNEPLKQAITNLGPAAVPALTQAMVHSSRGVRNRTAAILKGPLSCYAATVRANIRSLPVDDETKATALSALASFPWD